MRSTAKHLTPRIAALLIAALAVTACGNNDDGVGVQGGGVVIDETTTSAPADDCDTSKGTLIIGAVMPLTGVFGEEGRGVRNSARLAVEEANDGCLVPGYRLRLQAEDSAAGWGEAGPDTTPPHVGLPAARRLASNSDVVGVIGTHLSSVAQNVIPVLDGEELVMVSPGNSLPSLTRGEKYADAPQRQHDNYFRLGATDDAASGFAADYAVENIGKKAAIITDGATYGGGLAAGFERELAASGGEAVVTERVGKSTTDFSGAITKVMSSEPDLVYIAAEYPTSGQLSQALANAGLDVPVFASHTYEAKDGTLVTGAAPAEELADAKAFVRAYQNKAFSVGYGALGVYSYDATNVVISALAETVGDGEWSESKRAELVTEVQNFTGKGATGEIAFDEYGDNTRQLVTVFELSGGEWKPVETGEFGS